MSFGTSTEEKSRHAAFLTQTDRPICSQSNSLPQSDPTGPPHKAARRQRGVICLKRYVPFWSSYCRTDTANQRGRNNIAYVTHQSEQPSSDMWQLRHFRIVLPFTSRISLTLSRLQHILAASYVLIHDAALRGWLETRHS